MTLEQLLKATARRLGTPYETLLKEDFVIRVQYPWQSEPLCVLKAEVTVDEGVLLPTVARPFLHGYGEELPGTIRA